LPIALKSSQSPFWYFLITEKRQIVVDEIKDGGYIFKALIHERADWSQRTVVF
jgi:hypothetical protein